MREADVIVGVVCHKAGQGTGWQASCVKGNEVGAGGVGWRVVQSPEWKMKMGGSTQWGRGMGVKDKFLTPRGLVTDNWSRVVLAMVGIANTKKVYMGYSKYIEGLLMNISFYTHHSLLWYGELYLVCYPEWWSFYHHLPGLGMHHVSHKAKWMNFKSRYCKHRWYKLWMSSTNSCSEPADEHNHNNPLSSAAAHHESQIHLSSHS